MTTHTTPQDAKMLPRELTLIVAATNKMGIGKAGTLPWTGLRKEMAYFARVTKRASPGVIPELQVERNLELTRNQVTNSVIMGRKTWDSIPPRFRPLAARINIVITRTPSSATEGNRIVVPSLKASLEALESPECAGRAFVIGGAQIYKAALDLKEAKRILLTRVLSDFECDTFFPVTLGEDGEGQGWVRMSKEELDAWTGEEVPDGVQEENGTRYVFEMWERRD